MWRSAAALGLLAATVVPATSAAGQTALEERGRELYLLQCASCHGGEAQGTRQGPTLEGVGAASADFYLSSGRMPMTQGGQPVRKPPAYSRADIRALVAYVASLGPGPEIPEVDTRRADLVEGGELYRANCAACHQSAGIGGALTYGRSAPSIDDVPAVQVVEAMRIGPGQMPVFGPGQVSDEEAADIAAYVEYLHDPDDRGGLPLGGFGPVSEGFVALIFGLGGLSALGWWVVGRAHG